MGFPEGGPRSDTPNRATKYQNVVVAARGSPNICQRGMRVALRRTAGGTVKLAMLFVKSERVRSRPIRRIPFTVGPGASSKQRAYLVLNCIHVARLATCWPTRCITSRRSRRFFAELTLRHPRRQTGLAQSLGILCLTALRTFSLELQLSWSAGFADAASL